MTPTNNNPNTLSTFVTGINAAASIISGFHNIRSSDATEAVHTLAQKGCIRFLRLDPKYFVIANREPSPDYVRVADPKEPSQRKGPSITISGVPVDQGKLLKGLLQVALGIAGGYYSIINYSKR